MAVLTTRSKRGEAIITALRDAGISIHAVVVDRGQLSGRDSTRKLHRYLRRGRFSQIQLRAARRLRRLLSRRRRARMAGWNARASGNDLRVFEVTDPNSEEALELLTDLAPDLLVLGTLRILAPNVLSIAPMGVLNAHPGLLPDYRGVDVIAWALHNGDPLSVSIHFVDAGIDTGRIVAQRGFEVRAGDTLGSLKRRAGTIAAELMADAVQQLLDTGYLESTPQPEGRGHTYTRMPSKLMHQVEERLAAEASYRSLGRGM